MYLDDIKNRRGRFYITQKLLETIELEMLLKIFGEVVISRAEFLLARQAMEYIGFSEHFNEVEPYVVSPEYRADVDENGKITWEKVDES